MARNRVSAVDWFIGDRVTREIYMDDGTWAREGDSCLPGPLKRGAIVAWPPRRPAGASIRVGCGFVRSAGRREEAMGDLATIDRLTEERDAAIRSRDAFEDDEELVPTVAAFRQALQGMIDQCGDGDTTCMSANEDADEVLSSTDAGKDLLFRLEDGWTKANEWCERARTAERRVQQLEAHIDSCAECFECVIESGIGMPAPTHTDLMVAPEAIGDLPDTTPSDSSSNQSKEQK